MIVKLIVDGGSMKPGPAVAQQLGPMGINLGKVIDEVNKATSTFKGIKVPIEIDVDKKSKTFVVNVFSPPVAELIKKELGLEKGSGAAGATKVGNLGIEQIISIAKTKMPNMLAKDLKAAVKLVIGSCVSLGVLVEDKEAKEVIQDIDSGKYNKEISSEKTEISVEKKAHLDEMFSNVKARQEAAAKIAAEAAAAAEAAKAAAVTATPGAAAPAEGTAPAAGTAAKKEEAAAPAKKEAKPAAKKK